MSKSTTRQKIGEVGVDSGQVLICDPCYIKPHFSEETGEEYENAKGEKVRRLNFDVEPKLTYEGCCSQTLSDDGFGQLYYDLGHAGAGVASSTAWGDGSYPVYAEVGDDGRVRSLTIEFDWDEDEEECDTCGGPLSGGSCMNCPGDEDDD